MSVREEVDSHYSSIDMMLNAESQGSLPKLYFFAWLKFEVHARDLPQVSIESI